VDIVHIDLAGVHHQPRVAQPGSPQHTGEDVDRGRGEHADVQITAYFLGAVLEVADGVVFDVEDALGVTGERHARVGEAHPPAGALQQRCSECSFEGRELLGDRAGGVAQRAGGSAHRAVPAQLDQGA
jgi:hypothetical protein